MKRITLLFIISTLFSQLTFGQKVTVNGKITSKEDGLPIIGASIVEKGTTNGTITDFDGVYSLSVNNGAVLIFSYVGMETMERKVTPGGSLNIVCESVFKKLDK